MIFFAALYMFLDSWQTDCIIHHMLELFLSHTLPLQVEVSSFAKLIKQMGVLSHQPLAEMSQL